MASLIHATAHGLSAGDGFRFANILPTNSGVDEGTTYYVLASGLTTDAFEFSPSAGGTAFVLDFAILGGDIVAADSYVATTDGGMSSPTAVATPTGLAFSSTSALDADGHAVTRLDVSVTQPTSPTHRATIVTVEPASGNPVQVVIPVGQTTATVPHAIAGESYAATAQAQDVFGNLSAATSPVSHTAAVDTTAPGVPTGLSATSVILGAILTWDANTEADLAHYDIQVSADSGSTWTTYTAKTNVISITGLDSTITYAFQVQAVDLSTNPSGYCTSVTATPRLAATTDIAAHAITADLLAAQIVLAGQVVAGTLGSNRIELDADGERVYDSSGNILVNIPTVDAQDVYVNAQIAARALSVLGTSDFTGAVTLQPSDTLTLLEGITTPTAKPTLAAGWVNTTLSHLPSGYTVEGAYYDAAGGASGSTACFVCLCWSTDRLTVKVVELKASDLTADRTTTVAMPTIPSGYTTVNPGELTPFSLTRLGANWYAETALIKTSDFTIHPFVVTIVRSSGASTVTDVSAHVTTPNFGVTTDGTYLYLYDTNALTVLKYNSSLVYQSSVTLTAPSGMTDSALFPLYADLGSGGHFYIQWINGSTSFRFYEYATTGGAATANTDFPAYTLSSILTWDGTNFFGFRSTSRNTYTNWTWTTASAVYWVGYAWYDDAGTTHETAVSPRAHITMDRRQQLTVTVPSLPGAGGSDDPDKVRVYMKPNATDPGAGALKLQVTDALQTRALTTYVSGGAADGAGTVFPAGTPASLFFGPTGARLWSGGVVGALLLDANGASVDTQAVIEATSGQRALLGLRVHGDTTRLLLSGDATMVGLALGGGSAARDVYLYRNGAKSLVIDADGAGGALTEVLIEGPVSMPSHALAASFMKSGATTLTSASTWYQIPTNANVTFVAAYTGQRFLITWNLTWAVNGASQNILCDICVDSVAGTLATSTSLAQHMFATSGANYNFSGSVVYTAVSGDVGNTRYVEVFAQNSTSAGKALTPYAGVTYAGPVQVIALP